jgi:hypothetical protein
VEATWSRADGADCIRLPGLAGQPDVQVRPGTAPDAAKLPAMAGRLIRDGADACFVPRFPFVDGTSYTVTVAGVAAAVLTRPRPERPATAEVLGICPTAAEVPRNLLRCYVWFTAPMSEGYAAGHVRLVDEAGPMPGALLPGHAELWDAERRRLTVLLDPARIKRGLAGHCQAGYPLRQGEPFRLVVDEGFRDALGAPLRRSAERRYRVGPDERRRVDPGAWTVSVPANRTRQPLVVGFGRPLDHGLLARCLRVTGPGGQPVAGVPEAGPEERSWRLVPRTEWRPGPYRLVIDPVLEDLAGNSAIRVFDRDLTDPDDEPAPGTDEPAPATLPFRIAENAPF